MIHLTLFTQIYIFSYSAWMMNIIIDANVAHRTLDSLKISLNGLKVLHQWVLLL